MTAEQTPWTPGKRVEILYKTRGDNTRNKRFGYVVAVNTSGGMHFMDVSRPSEPGEVAFLVSRTADGRSGAVWYSFKGIRFTKPPRELLDQLTPDEHVGLDAALAGRATTTFEALVPDRERRHLVRTADAALRSIRAHARVRRSSRRP